MIRLSDHFIRLFNKLLLFTYRRTGGRVGDRLWRWDVLLLTTTGRKTGLARTTPLIYMPDGDRMIVVASNNGNPRMPAWYLNVSATPRVFVEHKGTQGYFQARTATADERPELWKRLIAYQAMYVSHQQHAPHEIPVVILEPEAAG
jgi:deazaflavin-dependent oxidoreductase (nitroreductase family)